MASHHQEGKEEAKEVVEDQVGLGGKVATAVAQEASEAREAGR